MIVVKAVPVDYESAAKRAKAKVPDKPVVMLSKHGVRKLYDNYEIIADVKTDASRFIRVAAATRDGYRFVILREFFFSRHGKWLPGANGLTIPMISPFFDGDTPIPRIVDVSTDFVDAIVKGAQFANTMPLVDKDKALYLPSKYMKNSTVKMKETSNENQQP